MKREVEVTRCSAYNHAKREEDGETVVWLREIDAGTDTACWIVCNRIDPGAVAFSPC